MLVTNIVTVVADVAANRLIFRFRTREINLTIYQIEFIILRRHEFALRWQKFRRECLHIWRPCKSISEKPQASECHKKYLWFISCYKCDLSALTVHSYLCAHWIASLLAVVAGNEHSGTTRGPRIRFFVKKIYIFLYYIFVSTSRPCYTPVCFTAFCFNDPYQFAPIFNLHSLILGLAPFGWLLTCYGYYIWRKYHFLLKHFYLRPLFQEQN